MEPSVLAVLVVATLSFLVPLAVFVSLFRVWIRARLAGVPLSLLEVIGMRLRRVNPNVIVDGCVIASRAGLSVSPSELEMHYLAGGDVKKVLLSVIAANERGIPLDFRKASAIDLAGKDPLAEALEGNLES